MGCGSSKNQPTLENVMTANREDSVVRGTSESTSTERRVILPLPAPAHETTKSTLVFDNQDDQLGGMMSGSRFSEDDVESKTPLPPNPPSTAVALPDPKDGISTLPPEVLENMTFCLLHFNDVYHIAPSAKEPVGGAARFAHTVRQYKEQYGADLLFSGDCYNPSLMSTVTRGKHMVPILNELGIRCSVYGNHDFDFGVDVLEELTAGSNSNWLMSNIVDESKGGKPAANGLLTYTFKQKARGWSKDEVTIGVIGCGEEEWLSCVKDLPEAIVYQNAIEVTNREAARLREEGCDFIIALTHMRHNNDLTFTGACPGVDIVLGGHDHFYKSEVLDSGQLLVKSGTDFKNLSFIAVSLPKVGSPSSAGPKQVKYNVERIDITSNIQEDPVVKSVVEGFENSLADKICKEICHLDCEMDISTSHVRTEESGMGNLIADIMKEHCEADCAFVNAGVMRADVVYNAGPITIKDLLDITPIEDIVVSVEITGAQLLGAIENGISKYPQEEGRFLQVSGLEMIGDVLQPAKQRVRQLLINGKQVVPTQTYIAATTAFLCKGCDGFDIMKGSKYVIDPENGPVLPTLVRKAIESMVAPDVKAMRKSSVRHARRSLGGKENVESKEAVEHVKRAYLPHICPRVEGRLRLMQGPQDAEDDPFSKAEKTGDAMMPPADPTGSHNPMGVVQKDVESVKSAFAAHKEHIPTTNVHWSDALLPYLGQTGTIINIITSEVSLTQLRFADKVAHWFPSRIVIDVVREDSQSVTNDKDSVHQPPGRVNSMVPKIRDRMNSQTRATPAAMVPNERTMSFIFRPVGGGEMMTKEDIVRRSASRPHVKQTQGGKPPAHSMPLKDLTSELEGLGEVLTDCASQESHTSTDSTRRKGLICELAWRCADDLLEDCMGVHPRCIGHCAKRVLQTERDYVNTSGCMLSQIDSVNSTYGLGPMDKTCYPLHFAAARGSKPTVALLIKYGADITMKSECGFTPREVACSRMSLALHLGRPQVIEKMQTMMDFLDDMEKCGAHDE